MIKRFFSVPCTAPASVSPETISHYRQEAANELQQVEKERSKLLSQLDENDRRKKYLEGRLSVCRQLKSNIDEQRQASKRQAYRQLTAREWMSTLKEFGRLLLSRS